MRERERERGSRSGEWKKKINDERKNEKTFPRVKFGLER